jgi:hypothetical protein
LPRLAENPQANPQIRKRIRNPQMRTAMRTAFWMHVFPGAPLAPKLAYKARGGRPAVSIDQFGERPPSWIELESVKRMPVVEEITSLSADNLRRTYPEFIIKLSPRRDGMKLKHALAIANGTARRS